MFYNVTQCFHEGICPDYIRYKLDIEAHLILTAVRDEKGSRKKVSYRFLALYVIVRDFSHSCRKRKYWVTYNGFRDLTQTKSTISMVTGENTQMVPSEVCNGKTVNCKVQYLFYFVHRTLPYTWLHDDCTIKWSFIVHLIQLKS